VSHRHLWEDQMPAERPGCTEVDPAVCLRPVTRDGAIAGYLFAHENAATPHRCEGMLATSGAVDPSWTATGSFDDGTLTLEPSVLCTIDGFHGFVRSGKWVPA